MKRLAAGLLVVLVAVVGGSASAKVYSNFDACGKFVPGDVVRMENSLAFPSYIYELEIRDVNIDEDGSCVVSGKRTLTHKTTGEVIVSENYTQVVKAKKETMNVVVDIKDENTADSGAGSTDNMPSSGGTDTDTVQNPDTGIEQSRVAGQERIPPQLVDKTPSTKTISPIRKIPNKPWYLKLRDWAMKNKVLVSVIILFLLGMVPIIQNSKFLRKTWRNMKKNIAKQMKGTGMLLLCVIVVSGTSTGFAANYTTYGGSFERKMCSAESNGGVYEHSWSSVLSEVYKQKSFSQPLVSGDYVYHYSGNKVYKIEADTGKVVGSAGGMDNGIDNVACGYMTMFSKYIFVGDRNLNMHVIDTGTMDVVGHYGLLSDKEYKPFWSQFGKINKAYGNKGITSAPYVCGAYDVYFGTSVGLFGKIWVNPGAAGTAGFLKSSILNDSYRYWGGDYDVFQDGESLCLVSSPVFFNNCLYIGTPCDGEFDKENGYICSYDLYSQDNILTVEEEIWGGINTTMAFYGDFNGGIFVFGDSIGRIHFANVDVSGDVSENEIPFDTGVGWDYNTPAIDNSAAVHSFGSGRGLAAVPVARNSRYYVIDLYTLDELFSIPATAGSIVNSPHFLQIGTGESSRVYLLYADGKKLCAADCSSDSYGGILKEAEIFLAGGNLESSVSPGSAITSHITVANERILFSDESGKLHCFKMKKTQSNFKTQSIHVYRQGENTPLTDEDYIEAGSEYKYKVIMVFKNESPWSYVDVPYRLVISDGEGGTYAVSFPETSKEEMQSEITGKVNFEAGGEVTVEGLFVFPVQFTGSSVQFTAVINPEFKSELGEGRIPEVDYGDNICSTDVINVIQRNIDLAIVESSIFPADGSYLPIDDTEGGEPAIICGVVINNVLDDSSSAQVNNVPVKLTIWRANGTKVSIPEPTKYITIPSKAAGEKPARASFYFEIPQGTLAIGEEYRIDIEVNPLGSEGKRPIHEITPQDPEQENIFENNDAVVVVTAADREDMDSYDAVWVDEGKVRRLSGRQTNVMSFNTAQEVYNRILSNEDYPSPTDAQDEGEYMFTTYNGNEISMKAGYGFDLRLRFSIFDVGPDAGISPLDWNSMDAEEVSVKFYIVKPDSKALDTPGMVLRNLESLGQEECINMIKAPDYWNRYDATELEKKRIYEIAMEENEETQDIIKPVPSGSGRSYTFAFSPNNYSSDQRRRIYLDFDTPDTGEDSVYSEDSGYAAVIRAEYSAFVGGYKRKLRKTLVLKNLIEVRGTMYDDDETRIIPQD